MFYVNLTDGHHFVEWRDSTTVVSHDNKIVIIVLHLDYTKVRLQIDSVHEWWRYLGTWAAGLLILKPMSIFAQCLGQLIAKFDR